MSRRHEPRGGEETPARDVDPVDTFLAQPDFEEEPGLDDAALERQRLQRQEPDADAIVLAIELLNEHHPYS
ncbi:MAG: hypothetical protein ABR963_00645 [Acidimicrobiales bacterium]